MEVWILYNILCNKYAPEIMETKPKYKNKNERQQVFKQIMHRLDIECFSITYKKSKSSARKMGKFKHNEVKELADYVRANKKKKYDLEVGIKAGKAVAMKVKKIEETLIGPQHKAAERCALFDSVTWELIPDENEILATTLKYNVGGNN